MNQAQRDAYRVTQEFLNETASIGGSDRMQVLLDAFKRARGVVMQCGLALQPPDHEAGPEAKPIDFGMKLERHVIFEGETPSSEMTAAVFTAQKMGCTNFEIVVRQAQKKRSRYDDDDRYVNPFFGLMQRHGGEVHEVKVYAVTIK